MCGSQPDGPDFFRIEVKDSGIGIRPEDMGKLFTEFQQLEVGDDQEVQRHRAGSGADQAHGRGPGRPGGAPRAPRARAACSSRCCPGWCGPGRSAPDPRPIRGLAADARWARPRCWWSRTIAEDRAWLVRTLTEAGYAVETAADGAEALARCEERAYDAITLDLLLPDMSGLKVLHAIRESGPNRDTPVIVVSVLADEQLVSGFAVQDVLSKPARRRRAAGGPAAGRGVGGRPAPGAGGRRRSGRARSDEGAADATWGTSRCARARPRWRCAGWPSRRPAAIVLDLLMPADGRLRVPAPAARPIRRARQIPVLVWTSKDLTAEERTRLARSAQGVMPKQGAGPGASAAARAAPAPGWQARASQHVHIGSTGQVDAGAGLRRTTWPANPC